MKQISNAKRRKICRILLACFLPTVVGVWTYGFMTDFFREPLYWLGLFFTVPYLILLMLLPSVLFAVVMECTGVKLIQRQRRLRGSGLPSLLYSGIGTATGGICAWILDSGSDFILIGLLTGLICTAVLLLMHLRERRRIGTDS